MKCARLVLILPLLVTGCTTTKLRNSTVQQARSLVELQYQQVLDNVAMFSANPDIIPSLVNLSDGSAQIADVGSASYLGDWHRAFSSHPTLLGSRTVVAQWSMSPVTNDNELELLQLAYRRAAGIDESLQDNLDLANDLAHELVNQLPEVDDYRGAVVNQYEDFKNRYRSGHLEYDGNGELKTPDANTNVDLTPKSLSVDKILSYIFIHSSSSDSFSIPRRFEQKTISSNDGLIIYDNEIIRFMNIHCNYSQRVRFNSTRKGLDGDTWFYINQNEYDAGKDPKPAVLYWATNPDKAHAFYAASRTLALDGSRVEYVTPEAVAARRLVKEIENDLLEIRCDRSWYGVGNKHDVPADACFVGHYCNTYVWVLPSGVKDLSTLTIKTLKFSGLIKDDSVLTVPGPRYTPASSPNL